MKTLTQVGQIQIHREWALERSHRDNPNSWRTGPFTHCCTKEEIWALYNGRVRLSVRELVKRLDKKYGYIGLPYIGVHTAWFLGHLFLFPPLKERLKALATWNGDDPQDWSLCRYVDKHMSLKEVYEAFFTQPIPEEWPRIFLPNKPYPYIPGQEPKQEA